MKKGIKSCLIIFLAGLVVLIGGAAAMFIAEICPPQGPWPIPPWCQENSNLLPASALPGIGDLIEDDFEYFSPGESSGILENQLLLISPNFAKPGDMIQVDGAGWTGLTIDIWSPGAVRSLHNQGLHLLGASMTIRHLNIPEADPKPELSAQDLNGNPIPLTKPGTEDYLPGEFFYSIFHPDWQELLLNQGRKFIDYGAEGIVMDEPNTYGDLVFEYGGSFDSYSLEGFREYLSEKYSSEQLHDLLAIDNIVDFNFRDYLVENNMEESWNSSKQNPPLITYEFFLFQNQGAEAFLRHFAEEMKTYAREEYNRDFVFSFNSNPLYDFSRFLAVDYLDYLSGEVFYFSSGHTRAAVIGKLADGVFDGQVMLLAEVSHDTGELPSKSTNLVKYMFADIFSNPNTSMVIPTDNIYTMRNWTYQDTFVTYDLQELEKYFNFLDQNRHFYNLDEPAQIAIVHSSPSLFANRYPSQEPLWGSPDLVNVTDILLSERIPFEMLVSGDGTWAKNHIDLMSLQDYQLVILPGVQLISDDEIDALLSYVERGGVVLQINGFGSHQKDGTPVQRSEISGLAQDGIHSFGQGVWHTLGLWEELGAFSWNDLEQRQVQPKEHSPDDPAVLAVREALSLYHSPEISTDAPYTVAIRRYNDGDRWVLHLVNYDYDQTTDEFSPTAPFQISVQVGDSVISAAKVYDFESGEVSELAFEQTGNLVLLEVPPLSVYSIVELNP